MSLLTSDLTWNVVYRVKKVDHWCDPTTGKKSLNINSKFKIHQLEKLGYNHFRVMYFSYFLLMNLLLTPRFSYNLQKNSQIAIFKYFHFTDCFTEEKKYW